MSPILRAASAIIDAHIMATSAGVRWFVGVEMILFGVGYSRHILAGPGAYPRSYAMQADILPLPVIMLFLLGLGAALVATSRRDKLFALSGRIVSAVSFSAAVGFTALWVRSSSTMGILTWGAMAAVLLVQAIWVEHEL